MQRPLLAAAILVPACLVLPRAVLAQAKPSANEIEVYGGELFGQPLIAKPLAGTLDPPNPRLADHPTYGVRLSHSFGEFGVELGVGQTRTQTERHPSETPGVSNLRVQTADLDVTWRFTDDGPITGYTLMGGGYARTRLVPDLMNPDGTVIRARNTATANIGIGARAYATSHLIVRAEVRYRYLGELVTDRNARGVSALETTFGIGWRF